MAGGDSSHPVISVEFWLRLRGHIRLNQHAPLRRGSGAGPGPRGGEQSDPGAPRLDVSQRLFSAGGRSAMNQRSGRRGASEFGRWCASGCTRISPGGAWPETWAEGGPVGMVTATNRSGPELVVESLERNGCADWRTGGDGLAAVPTGKFSRGGGWPDPGRGPVARRRVARPGARGTGSLVPPPWGPVPLRSLSPVILLACPSRTRVVPC